MPIKMECNLIESEASEGPRCTTRGECTLEQYVKDHRWLLRRSTANVSELASLRSSCQTIMRKPRCTIGFDHELGDRFPVSRRVRGMKFYLSSSLMNLGYWAAGGHVPSPERLERLEPIAIW